jgi:hypothetical protein
LGPKPGGRIRSVVSAPKNKTSEFDDEREGLDSGGGHGIMVDLDESGDEEL